MREINYHILEEMRTGTPEIRKYIGEKAPEYFCFYYFADAFSYPMADFHWLFVDDYEDMLAGDITMAMWLAFRESAKTTWAKMLVTHAICFKKKRYINWDSYDEGNAKQALFDIATWLQTNERIVRDFGFLYKKKRSQKNQEEVAEPEKKGLGNFITTNRIKVEAFSTGVSTRGRQFADRNGKVYRPDMYVFDDIENSITVKSMAITESVMEHVKEAITGMPQQGGGSVLVLGNWISEDGTMAKLAAEYEGKSIARVRNIPGIVKGIIQWPDKYVFTKQDALRVNFDLPKDQWKVSLEQLEEKWGKEKYQTEFLHNPSARSDFYFDRSIIRTLMEKSQSVIPKRTIAGQKVYFEYSAQHRYALGADTAGGTGADSNASAVINFATTPKRLVSIYENNQELPNVFAWTIKRHAEMYGGCFVIPEINNTGYATVAELLSLNYTNLYHRITKNKTTDKLMKQFGWMTTQGSKSEILAQLKTAVESGDLEIPDYDTLNEMYHFTLEHANDVNGKNLTKHFDRVMAVALAWEGRTHVKYSKEEKKINYKSPNAGNPNKPYIP